MPSFFVLAFALALLLTAGLGMIVQKILRPLEKMDLIYMMLGTLEIGIVLQNLSIIIWGPDGIAVPFPINNTPWMVYETLF